MRAMELHVVVGGGIAGCLSALFRRRAGFQVVMLDRRRSESSGPYPVCTETSNIVSENHSGAEYPFDPRSAQDCFDGRLENEKFFPELIYGGKDYTRILASQSMIDAGIDILAACRRNMEIIRGQYQRRCREDAGNMVFGDPAHICREIPHCDGIHDVAGAFITPQRGLNPVFVATAIDWELKRAGVEFHEGCNVTAVHRLNDGRYRVEFRDAQGRESEIVADQVSLCSAAHSFRMAKSLNPAMHLPRIFVALREILYVSLPDGTDKTFTCLKLEDEYGGMLSPLNDSCAMIYYPPAAHILNVILDPGSCSHPPEYDHYLRNGHPEQELRAEATLRALRRYYPELRRAEILGMYLKVAINTVADSRVRRNPGVFQVLPACTMTVLPKWTMCVVNVKKELDMALDHSCNTGNLDPSEAAQRRADVANYRLQPPDEWTREPGTLRRLARRHAANMRVPDAIAEPMLAMASYASSPCQNEY